jgi:group I intron endonuclease
MKRDLTNIIGYIYKVTSPNNEIYIGQTINIRKRKYSYKKEQFKKQTKLWRNCSFYNWNPIDTFEVIDECLCGEDKTNLNEKEIYWISYYDSYKNGLNCTIGGKGQTGKIWTKEERERQREITLCNGTAFKIGNLSTLGTKASDETKKRISESNKSTYEKGRVAWNKGQETPIEVKEKISDSVKGDKNGFYGKKHSSETIEILKEKLTGRKHSEETKLKMSQSSKRMYHPHTYGKAVLQYDMFNNFIKRYDSIKEASEETGCSRPRIVDVCKGNRKHTRNFIWKYE